MHHPTWNARLEPLLEPKGLRIALELAGHSARWQHVILAWRTDPTFRTFFNALVAEAPFPALRWETPALDQPRLAEPFACVMLDCPSLTRRANPAPFAEHLEKTSEPVACFSNLSGDCQLIVPCPRSPAADYAHLAAFARTAPEDQHQSLWTRVGDALETRVASRTVWLSTAGLGVPWLHVRLDDRPKYYAYRPFKSRP